MLSDLEKADYSVFDSCKQLSTTGSEFWRARDLQSALGYERWENFEEAIRRAWMACSESGKDPDHQFRETTKQVEIGKGAIRQVKDYFLSRYACYLIAMNGDPSKAPIAVAQTYFAIQTRRQEMSDMMTEDERRLVVRERVKDSVVKLNKAASRAGVRNYAFFHDAGYRGMYGMGTSEISAEKESNRMRICSTVLAGWSSQPTSSESR